MATIKVDHNQFERAASAIDTYITYMKSNMKRAGSDVVTLSNTWRGKDNIQFRTQWSTVTAKDSTYDQMIKTLESYARYLRYADVQYKTAQNAAINRANGLPRY